MRWNFFIRFFLEMTLEISICVLLNFKEARWDHGGVERLGIYCSWAFLGIYALFFIFVVWLMFWGSD